MEREILPAGEPVVLAIIFSRTMSRGLLSLLLALCVALVAASDVLELDGNSFESGIADKNIILVEFYAPWYELDCNQKLQIRFVHALVLNCDAREVDCCSLLHSKLTSSLQTPATAYTTVCCLAS